ncbi:TPA: ABC transporter ATP-binding protein, partial [Streptococcus pyogenes]|nr:ABC transporter ATP-binding protein [Streptococcus pyogenes]
MIEFKNVSFTYDSVDRNAGIYNVNLKINDGEVIVFCGESGCGKTTISRLINGLIPGYYTGTLNGEVIVRDYKISQNPIDELSRYVGSVFQNPRTQFFNVDSTSEIAFACENFEVPREEICTRIGKVTQELNIRNLLDRNLFSMSGGEKQKIACASAAVMEPEIYVLDEPSSNLDIGTIEMLKAIISRWKEKKATIIIAEHRLRYLIDIADKFIY